MYIVECAMWNVECFSGRQLSQAENEPKETETKTSFQRIITPLINRLQSIRLGWLSALTDKQLGDPHQLAKVTVE